MLWCIKTKCQGLYGGALRGCFNSVYQKKVPRLGKVHLACLSVMTKLILLAPIGENGCPIYMKHKG